MKKYLFKHWFLLLVGILVSCGSAIVKILIPVYIGYAVDELVVGAVNFPAVFANLQKIAVCVALLFIGQWATTKIFNDSVYKIGEDIRNDLFIKVQKLPLRYLDGHLHGETMNIIINDVETFCDGILLTLNSLFVGIITIIGIIFFMFRINVTIALAVVCLTPLSLLIANFIAKRTHQMFLQNTKLRAQQTAMIDETINNQNVIKSFNYQQKTQYDFDELNDQLKDCATKATFYSSLVNPSTRLINNLIYAITGLLGAVYCLQGAISIGSLSTFLSYASEFGKPFNDISSVLSELQNASASAARIMNLLNETEESDDSQKMTVSDNDSSLHFENVTFGYNPDKVIIDNFTLHVKNGQRIAFVGKTGCGKTTLINLILRFYDIDSGCIKIDDYDISDLTRDNLRSNFGMVLQDSWIKQGTVKENLLLGNPDCSEERMIEICKITHCHNFIRRMKNKYDTVIDNANSLSAGQKQLLSIARVMIADPKILILDEATSNIDTRTELIVQNALEELMKNKTSLIVAHRLSTIVNSDLIVVMDAGRIMEIGTHKELLEKKSYYYNLYNSQFKQD